MLPIRLPPATLVFPLSQLLYSIPTTLKQDFDRREQTVPVANFIMKTAD